MIFALHYTTVLSITFSLTAATAIAGAALAVVKMDKGDHYWSTRKIVTFWSLVVLAATALSVAIAAPVTAFTEARKSERGLGDGPRFDSEQVDGRPVDGIAEMADNFPNVATKCVWDGWRAFVTSNGDHLSVVRDESCTYVETGPS